ncbi:tetratricopeptide repeat protein [Mucilaginibacter sp. ZT4R22]|uniref:Tetratricopeptide repeat protein n=1 Tax=Mucilaginibacter pankratovii TaxID=2772110 RepID=A0ABR7WR17_9SPHI|nr:tetratricopeptide repeat protein [Mucilaginibacter pankratovii]MBD1364766.1 tetratricopeptide repeat protein [Mucilaginibacter pankratovii]
MTPKCLNRSKGALLVLALFFAALSLSGFKAAVQNKPSAYIPGLFAPIKNLPENKRVDEARLRYKINCRNMAEQDAMKSLDNLTGIAKELADLPLECAIFDMRADYYSVNRRYNPLSNSYYEKAILFAEEHALPLETAIYMHRKAVYLFIYKQNISACRYFLFSQEKFREIGFDKVPDMGAYFSEVADFYYAIGDYDNARENLKQTLKYQQPSSRSRINTLNTMGLTYRSTQQFKTAMQYFDEALSMAKAAHDTVWVGITTGNIGSIYFMQSQYKKALPLIQTDYKVSLQYNQIINAATAMLRLVKISLEADSLGRASQQLALAYDLLNQSREDVLRYRVTYYGLKASLYEKLGQMAQSNLFNKKYSAAKDSLENRDNLAEVERVRLQWELDKSKAQLNKLKINGEIGAYKRNTVIIVLLLLMVISILIYNRQRLKAKKDQELLTSEKLRLDEELNNAALALHGYTENLMQKNLLIEEFKTEVEKLQLKFSSEGDARELDNMMKAHIMTDENWGEFKKLFTKVHPAFFYRLRNKYPHLTGTDTRLMALIKLNLNNREMAGMLGITTDGIKKAKQRLRKKMELEAGNEIEDTIAKL